MCTISFKCSYDNNYCNKKYLGMENFVSRDIEKSNCIVLKDRENLQFENDPVIFDGII